MVTEDPEEIASSPYAGGSTAPRNEGDGGPFVMTEDGAPWELKELVQLRKAKRLRDAFAKRASGIST